jgi:iron complex transport system permease protein
VAIAAVLTAVLDLLLLTTDRGNEARAVLAWTLGGLGGVNWDTLWLPSAALLVGIAVLMVQARNLNLLLAGEEAATTMGLDVARFRARMFVLLSLVTGVLVAACGPIGFVGLMLPHIVRLATAASCPRPHSAARSSSSGPTSPHAWSPPPWRSPSAYSRPCAAARSSCG